MIKEAGLQVPLGFTPLLGALTKEDKSQADKALTFFGLRGEVPCPDNDMIIRISLPGPKKAGMADIALDVASKGAISNNDLEKVMDRLSFTQTSVFGRFGRTLLTPLRDKLKSRPYVAILSTDEVEILRCGITLLMGDISGMRFPKSPRREVLVYTDSATSARIVASLAIDVKDFENHMGIRNLWAEVPYPKWGNTCILTTYIYGVEMIAILSAIFLDAEYIRGKNVAFYIDNSNFREAVVRGDTETKAINRMVELFWPQVKR